MTDSLPDPAARLRRLHTRVRDVHYVVGRLAEDLREEEGKSYALSAEDDLSTLGLRLDNLIQDKMGK